MATYTIEAPDGKRITLEGPEGASQADILAQAQKLYRPEVAPKATQPAAPKRNVTVRPQDAQVGLDRGSQILEQRIKNLSPAEQEAARDSYFRQTAELRMKSATPVSQKRGATNVEQQRSRRRDVVRRATYESVPVLGGIARNISDDALAATEAGFIRGAFGLPERIGALVTGQPVESIRADVDADASRSTVGNILGQIMSGTLAGSGAASGVRTLGGKLAASNAPRIAQGAGRLLESAATLKKGQGIRNAAKAVTAGGAAGAAQAAGEGSDVGTGALVGAAGTAVLGSLFKGGEYLTRPVRDFLRLSDAGSFLRRMTNASVKEIRDKITEIRATGTEPTLFEVLPLADRNKISSQVLRRTNQTAERTASAAGDRLTRMGSEMQRGVRQSTGQARQQARQELVQAMQDASGRPSANRGVLPAGTGADASPSAMERFAREEANARMAPFDNRELFEKIDDLLPQHPEMQANGDVHMVTDDEPVLAMIRRKAKLLMGKDADNPSGGITGRNVTALLSDLREYAGAGHTDSDVASAAVSHIEDILSEQHPDFLDAAESMRDAFAARSRTREGMAEGFRTRTEQEISRPTQETRNAYQTPEGATGRALGQANALERDFSGTANNTVRRAMQIAEDGNVQAALRANIGDEAADAIIAQARAQVEGARRLHSVASERGASDAAELGPDALVNGILALSPTSMLTTKAAALGRLISMTHLPQSRANQMVELLFSGDPATTNRAVQLLGRSGPGARRFLGDLAGSLGIGSTTASLAGEPDPAAEPSGGQGAILIPSAAAAEVPTAEPEAETPAEEIAVDEETDDRPYGRAVIEGLFPDAYVTDDVRDPNSDLGRKNPDSWHVNSDGAVDVRPIPGMTFEEFIAEIEANGYEVIEAIDEVNHPSGHATGPHWHVVLR